jgi:Kdo2-lipid IVA lauroyltransferase/acyltransferase
MSLKNPSIWLKLGWRLEALAYDTLVGAMRLLPVDVVSDIGAALLTTIGPLTGVQKVVNKNLDIAFPEKDAAWRKRIVRAQWDNLGRTFAEFAIMDKITVANGRIVVENGERLEEIKRQNKPVVFISGHFSNWEVMPSVIMEYGVRCVITYRAANNPYVDERIRVGRARYGVKLFAPKGGDGAKEMLLRMDEGESVALMNDQKFNRGVSTPFFNSRVDTAPGPTRLAMRHGTVLQPMSVQRTHKARFKVVVHEPITVENTGSRGADIDATVCKISAFIESLVREHPEEWFWSHKRWPKEVYKGEQPPAAL